MRFTWEDTSYYLKCYKQVKLELNLFLVSNLSCNVDDLCVQENQTGNRTEKQFVSKLSNRQYRKDSFALKCVDLLYSEMNSKEYKIMSCKYIYCMSTKAISTKVNYSESTVERTIREQRKKLFEKLTVLTGKSVLK